LFFLLGFFLFAFAFFAFSFFWFLVLGRTLFFFPLPNAQRKEKRKNKKRKEKEAKKRKKKKSRCGASFLARHELEVAQSGVRAQLTNGARVVNERVVRRVAHAHDRKSRVAGPHVVRVHDHAAHLADRRRFRYLIVERVRGVFRHLPPQVN
jgi:hypothetical protein